MWKKNVVFIFNMTCYCCHYVLATARTRAIFGYVPHGYIAMLENKH